VPLDLEEIGPDYKVSYQEALKNLKETTGEESPRKSHKYEQMKAAIESAGLRNSQ